MSWIKKFWDSIKKAFKSAKPTTGEENQQSPSTDDKKPPQTGTRKTLGVIVGHERAAPGADLIIYLGRRISEYQYNSEIAEIIKQNAFDFDVEIIFRDGVGIHGAYRKAIDLGVDAVIELHFNSYNGKVRGTETLCTSNATDVEFATLAQKHMCKVFNRNGMSRGVLKIDKSDRGGGNVHAFYTGPNCLVEPFFGDNEQEAGLAMSLKKDYALSLIQACKEYWGI